MGGFLILLGKCGMETIVYIDGYNLFYGCLKHTNYKWLDLIKLFSEHILKMQNPHFNVIKIKFFTADIKAKIATHGRIAQKSQQDYHHALLRLYLTQIEIIKGYYSLEKANFLVHQSPPDKSKRCEVWKLEEKQTDVNIALTAYRDACKNQAKHLVFVSNDTDLAPALKALREDFKDTIQIGVIIPILKDSVRPNNKQLSEFADWTRQYILNSELENSQLPDKIATNKKPILKPSYW